MDLHLKNKVVMIAGSSQGIGYAVALAFAREGAHVAICARNQATLEKAAKTIKKQTGAAVLATVVELSQANSIQNWVNTVLKQFKTVDICITNAGGPPSGRFLDLNDEEWLHGFDLTLMSAVRLSRAVIPTIQKQKWGRIIHLCSYSVPNPIKNLTLSNSIRSAVVALAKTQADELGKNNILVNSLLTGWTNTEHTKSLLPTEKLMTKKTANIPLGRIGHPEEIAAPLLFLSSPGADFITGTCLTVDGGESRFPF